ncbi:MAG: hypothetical protein M1319_02620 [Chloroflexi bacterium]|nr:hypothetical protein [Chloroflexota bacterium]
MAADIPEREKVYASLAGMGVYWTPDGGLGWNTMDDGLRGVQVNALVLSQKSGDLFAGTGDGVWMHPSATVSSEAAGMSQPTVAPETSATP